MWNWSIPSIILQNWVRREQLMPFDKYTNNAGLTPMEYHEKYSNILNSLPLHLIWGSEDAITPIHGDVGSFYCDRVANNRGGNGRTTIDMVKSGHVPFDDNPIDTHAVMMRWLEKIERGR